MVKLTITIGIKVGVKLTVILDFAASDNSCSISGTEIKPKAETKLSPQTIYDDMDFAYEKQ